MALIQSNMALLSEVHGPSYHWIPDLYTRVGLPVVDDIVDACKRAVCDADKTVYTRRDETKQLRIRRKQARVEENEERKRVRQQLVQHTYGDAEEYGDQADDDEAEAAGIMVKENQGTSAEVVVVGTVAGATKCCKCGSTKHICRWMCISASTFLPTICIQLMWFVEITEQANIKSRFIQKTKKGIHSVAKVAVPRRVRPPGHSHLIKCDTIHL